MAWHNGKKRGGGVVAKGQPDNCCKDKRGGVDRLYTSLDSKAYRAASAYELGAEVLKVLKT